MTKTEVAKTMYTACDGKQFDTEKECIEYESTLKWDEIDAIIDMHTKDSIFVHDGRDGTFYSRVLKLSHEEKTRLDTLYEGEVGAYRNGRYVSIDISNIYDCNDLYLWGVHHFRDDAGQECANYHMTTLSAFANDAKDIANLAKGLIKRNK